jgi:hypothetical protein
MRRRRYYVEKPAAPVRWFGWRPEMDRDPDRCCVAPGCSRVAVRLNRCEPHARALEAARDLPTFALTFTEAEALAPRSVPLPGAPCAQLDLYRASQEELPL